MFASIWQLGRLCWGVTTLPCSGCVRQQVSGQPVWVRLVSTLHNFTGRCECKVTADNLGVCVCHQHPTRLLNSRWQKCLSRKQSTVVILDRPNNYSVDRASTKHPVWGCVWEVQCRWRHQQPEISRNSCCLLHSKPQEIDKTCSRMVLRLILQPPRCCSWRRYSRIGPLSHQMKPENLDDLWDLLLCYSRGVWACFALTYGCRAPISGESYKILFIFSLYSVVIVACLCIQNKVYF